MKKITALVLLTIFFISCAPAPFKPLKQPEQELKFDKTPAYSIQEELNKIPKPDLIKRMYVKKLSETTFEVVADRKQATHIMLAPSEYAKVGAVVKLATTYKELVLDQEILINTYVDQINALKELLAMEQKKTAVYRELWINSENAYRQEKWQHDRDNMIYKTGLYAVTIGSIVVMLLLL